MFNTNDYSYSETNKDIESKLRAAGTLKTGAEFRYGPVSFRAGCVFYQSPYTRYTSAFGKYRNIYSGGVGLKGENFYFDLALQKTTKPGFNYMYSDYFGN